MNYHDTLRSCSEISSRSFILFLHNIIYFNSSKDKILQKVKNKIIENQKIIIGWIFEQTIKRTGKSETSIPYILQILVSMWCKRVVCACTSIVCLVQKKRENDRVFFTSTIFYFSSLGMFGWHFPTDDKENGEKRDLYYIHSAHPSFNVIQNFGIYSGVQKKLPL